MTISIAANTLLGAVLYGIVFAAAAFVLTHFIRRLEKQMETHLTDTTGLRFASSLVQVFIFVFAFIFYARLIPQLQQVATAALTGVSVVSVVVGLAAQAP